MVFEISRRVSADGLSVLKILHASFHGLTRSSSILL